MDTTTFVLISIITVLLVVIMYLYWRIEQLDKKLDAYGTISFGELEALSTLGEAQKDLAQVIGQLMADVYDDSPACDNKTQPDDT